MENRIVMVSEDRREFGIIGCRDLMENATLADNCTGKGIIAGRREQRERAKEQMMALNVKAPSFQTKIENLSG